MDTEKHIFSIQDGEIYQGEQLILKDVNIHLDKGEFVYLIGRTGTGKSSLLKTLYGDLPLQKQLPCVLLLIVYVPQISQQTRHQ